MIATDLEALEWCRNRHAMIEHPFSLRWPVVVSILTHTDRPIVAAGRSLLIAVRKVEKDFYRRNRADERARRAANRRGAR